MTWPLYPCLTLRMVTKFLLILLATKNSLTYIFLLMFQHFYYWFSVRQFNLCKIWIWVFKNGLIKYAACISFIVTGKCVPFRTFLCIIFNILSIPACFGKHFCTSFPLSTWLWNSGGYWNNDLSGLWYMSDNTPSWLGEISSKYMLMFWSNKSMSKSHVFLGIICVAV